MTPLLSFAVALLAAQAPRPYTIEDQVQLRRITEFSVSPDGSRIVYGLRTVELDANRVGVDLWLMNADGSGVRALTTHESHEGGVRWAPDGKSLFFLSHRGGPAQVYQLPLDGGEARAVTRSPLDIGTFQLSPRGDQLAFSTSVFPNCDLDCTAKRLEEQSKRKSTGLVYETLLFRHWDHWRDGRRAHIFTTPVSSFKPVDVMKALDADSPVSPFGSGEDYTWTPDGKSLVFAARDVGAKEAWSTDVDLFLAPADGSGRPMKVTTTNRAWDGAPAFSPDGKQLAYLAMARPGYEADKRDIVVRNWADGKERKLTQAWDRSADNLVWARDGKSLYATADHLGHHALFSIDVADGKVTPLVTEGSVGHVALGRPGTLVYALDSLTAPADLHAFALEGKTATPLTQVNKDALAKLALGPAEQFEFQGGNNDTVRAWLVRPVNFDARKLYPIAFLIHGGPQGSFGNHWHYRWNPQVYAGAGYAVVMIDFHGSTGYGQAFSDAIRGDWGGKPLEDLQKGLKAALKKYAFLDGKRACGLGASYGGYLVNWIAGNWSDGFSCLVNHDGIFDTRMGYYDTEELWFPEWEHKGTPWDAPAEFGKHNPAEHVAKWKTPMLVVHGGRDFRVVETQGLATFTALQRRGVPSKLLYFPDENHWVLKAHNSIQWHQTVLGWLGQWTRQ